MFKFVNCIFKIPRTLRFTPLVSLRYFRHIRSPIGCEMIKTRRCRCGWTSREARGYEYFWTWHFPLSLALVRWLTLRVSSVCSADFSSASRSIKLTDCVVLPQPSFHARYLRIVVSCNGLPVGFRGERFLRVSGFIVTYEIRFMKVPEKRRTRWHEGPCCRCLENIQVFHFWIIFNLLMHAQIAKTLATIHDGILSGVYHRTYSMYLIDSRIFHDLMCHTHSFGNRQ